DIPVNVKEKAGMTTEQIEKTEAETKATGELRYVWDPEKRQIRMAMEGEKGGTLAQAKELKKMAEEDELGGKEPAFVLGEQGAWTLNPKGKIGFGEFAVFQMYQDSLKKGEPIDPVEELARREEASVRLKEAMGVKAGGQDTEMTMLDKLEKLGMLKKGEGSEGAFLAQLDALGLLKKTGGGEGDEVELLSKLSSLGLLRKTGDEEGTGLKTELSDLRKTIEDMKDERHKAEMAGLQGQILQVQETHKGQMREILDKMEDLKKPTTGKTEMDIISDVATGVLGEAKGLRSDVKEVLRELDSHEFNSGDPSLGVEHPTAISVLHERRFRARLLVFFCHFLQLLCLCQRSSPLALLCHPDLLRVSIPYIPNFPRCFCLCLCFFYLVCCQPRLFLDFRGNVDSLFGKPLLDYQLSLGGGYIAAPSS
ncbi:unnamed protein product, partial [marine sediment metagenome]